MVHANGREVPDIRAEAPLPVVGAVLSESSPAWEINEALDTYLADELATLRGYQEAIQGEERVFAHPVRVVKVLYDFANKKIAPEAYAAALLHDVAQDLSNPARSQYAARALAAYRQKITDTEKATVPRKGAKGLAAPKKWENIVAILADLDTVEEASEVARFHDYENPKLRKILRSNKDTVVRSGLWDPKDKVRLVDSSRLRTLVEDVTPQAIFVKAAEMYDNLAHRPPSDRALFQDVYDTLSFYAPVVYIKGFDAFESALKTLAEGWQMRLSGNYDEKLAKAERQISSLGSDEHCIAVGNAVLKRLLGVEVDFSSVTTNLTKHGVLFAVSEFSYDGFSPRDTTRAIMRRKGTTSTVRKNDVNVSQEATDLLGITVVAPNAVQMMKIFGDLVQGYLRELYSQENEDIRPASSPSRQESIHVSGPTKLIEAIRKSLIRREISSSVLDRDVDLRIKNFRTAKIGLHFGGTDEIGEFRDVGVEIQVQSEADRKAARVDELQSHLAYKNPGQFTSGDLRHLNLARYRLGAVRKGATTEQRMARINAQIDMALRGNK